MRLKWYRLRPAQKALVKCVAIIVLIEGVLWGGIFLGKGLQQVFWLRWKWMIADVRPVQGLPFASVINQCGRDYNVDPTLIAAVIRCESSFNPQAVSKAGAVGLMQICTPTWQEIKKTRQEWQDIQGPEDDLRALYQPQINIAAGTMYLQSMLRRYGGDPVKAIAAYNAGPGSVDRYGGIPPYEETTRYVRHVAAVWGEYRGIPDASPEYFHWGCTLERAGLMIQVYLLWVIGAVWIIISTRSWLCRHRRRW